jgi:8-oxo-dGTP diphosphatase
MIPVVAAIIVRDERVLLGLRPREKRHGGLWEFPGGKCDPGEGDAEAVGRELREELGVLAQVMGPPIAVLGDPGSVYSIRFLPVSIEGEPIPLEHDALRWVTPEEARDLSLAPSDARFVQESLRGFLQGTRSTGAPAARTT